jgi:hypothetical protein
MTNLNVWFELDGVGVPCQIIAAMSSKGIGVEASCVDTYMNGTYFCSYVPKVAGSYLLAIMLDGVHVRDSPYAVTVSVGPASPSRCVAPSLKTLVSCGCGLLRTGCPFGVFGVVIRLVVSSCVSHAGVCLCPPP